jgi:hypothetical protein
MRHTRHAIWFGGLVALTFLLSAGNGVNAQQDQPAFSKEAVERAKREYERTGGAPQAAAPDAPIHCRGPINQVIDVADERLRFTSANYFAGPGGGEGGRFDKNPVLSTRVVLSGGCLDAHLSAIVGGRQAYGVAALTMFQVTLTRVNPPAGPRHMVGHFETPFGAASPAIALEAERDVDMLGANFFQPIGGGPHALPPGTYRVDVWWAGAGPGGAIGAAFVLKLYMR